MSNVVEMSGIRVETPPRLDLEINDTEVKATFNVDDTAVVKVSLTWERLKKIVTEIVEAAK